MATSQILAVKSRLEEARSFSSGLKIALYIAFVCAVRVLCITPVSMSTNLILPSPPATTSVLPSRLRLKLPTPGLTFGGKGGGGRQFESVVESEWDGDCARHEGRLKIKRKAMQLARNMSRGI